MARKKQNNRSKKSVRATSSKSGPSRARASRKKRPSSAPMSRKRRQSPGRKVKSYNSVRVASQHSSKSLKGTRSGSRHSDSGSSSSLSSSSTVIPIYHSRESYNLRNTIHAQSARGKSGGERKGTATKSRSRSRSRRGSGASHDPPSGRRSKESAVPLRRSHEKFNLRNELTKPRKKKTAKNNLDVIMELGNKGHAATVRKEYLAMRMLNMPAKNRGSNHGRKGSGSSLRSRSRSTVSARSSIKSTSRSRASSKTRSRSNIRSKSKANSRSRSTSGSRKNARGSKKDVSKPRKRKSQSKGSTGSLKRRRSGTRRYDLRAL